MQEITHYYAMDGAEFTDKKQCQEYQYSLIDWSNVIKQNIAWIKIRMENDTPVITEIIPFTQPQPNDIYTMMCKHYYLYIQDSESLKSLRDISYAFIRKDEDVIDHSLIGLNHFVDCGDVYDEVENIEMHLCSLYEDLRDLKEQIDKEETLLKLKEEIKL